MPDEIPANILQHQRRGLCSVCSRVCHVKLDGTVHMHRGCPGSGQPPRNLHCPSCTCGGGSK